MTNLMTSTIRPGRIVVLRTSITGNVSYLKTIIEPEYETDDGKKRARWETERTVIDSEENEEATKIRSRVRSNISTICVQTAFGLLCPESKVDLLDKAIGESRALADDFNSRAKTTKIAVYVIAGKVADSDVEAVRAINSEVRDLMQAMETGLANLNPKMVREAADKARSLGSMLSDEAAAKVKDAIAVARKAAIDIVKASEQGAAEIDLLSIRKITESRTAFLDITEAGDVSAPIHEGRAIDLAPLEDDQPIAPSAPSVPVPQFEMD